LDVSHSSVFPYSKRALDLAGPSLYLHHQTRLLFLQTPAPPFAFRSNLIYHDLKFQQSILEVLASSHTLKTTPYTKTLYSISITLVNQNTINMLASRSAKPKLSLSISTASVSSRPSLSLKSPMAPLKSPVPPSPITPTARNTRLNQRGYSTMQQPTYSYVNSSSSRSILKKSSPTKPTSQRRQLSFSENPVVYSVTPIEEEDYYGNHVKMSREERRWQRR